MVLSGRESWRGGGEEEVKEGRVGGGWEEVLQLSG